MFNNIGNIYFNNKRYEVFSTQHLLNKRKKSEDNRLGDLTYDHLVSALFDSMDKGLLDFSGKVKISFGENEDYKVILVAVERYRLTVVSVIACEQSQYKRLSFFPFVKNMIIMDNYNIFKQTDLHKQRRPKMFTGIHSTSLDFQFSIFDLNEASRFYNKKRAIFKPTSRDAEGNEINSLAVDIPLWKSAFKYALLNNDPNKHFKICVFPLQKKSKHKYFCIQFILSTYEEEHSRSDIKVIRYFYSEVIPKNNGNTSKSEFILGNTLVSAI